MYRDHHITVVIPALNEAPSIASVVSHLPAWIDHVIVVDNGSTDRTADIAQQHGATVVREPRRGYGVACLRGLVRAASGPATDLVLFVDGDGSADPADIPTLLDPLVETRAELVIGSRVLGEAEHGALSMPQRFGNALTAFLLRRIWGIECTDLGPLRAVRFDALRHLEMSDLDYGWTVQMQARAASAHLRTIEVPVQCLRRIGQSKISGTIRGVIGAGTKILWTIGRECLRRHVPRWNNGRIIVFSRYPEAGRSKTRLIPALGAEGAADLQRQMTSHVLRQLDEMSHRRDVSVEIRYTDGDRAGMADCFGSGRRYVHQGPGDLGTRMASAFREAFDAGSERVVCIGSDCPAVNANLARRALDALTTDDVVLGPAKDGGYYLIGMRALHAALFENMEWGTDSVLECTRQRLRDHDLQFAELETLTDIDEPDDLSEWDRVFQASRAINKPPWISIIIPALNEAAAITETIQSAQQCSDAEILVIDGGSADDTAEIAAAHGARVIHSEPGRGRQMNAGAQAARGDVLLFLHADTRLPFDFASHVRRILDQSDASAGAFRMALDATSPSFRFIEWGTNLRSRVRQLPYGDQAIFVRAADFRDLGGFSEWGLMEDVDLVRRLQMRGRIRIAPASVLTSARRWQTQGAWRTTLRNQFYVNAFRFGVSATRIARWRGNRTPPSDRD